MTRQKRSSRPNLPDGLVLKTHSHGFQAGWPAYYCAQAGKHWWIHDANVLTQHKYNRFLRWKAAGVDLRLPAGTNELFTNLVPQADDSPYDPGLGFGPEAEICKQLKLKAISEGWVCDKTFGTVYQTGWPDYYCAHKDHGAFWLEVKSPRGSLEASQYAMFTKLEKVGIPVFILTDPEQFPSLFKQPPNWRAVPRKKWKVPIR